MAIVMIDSKYLATLNVWRYYGRQIFATVKKGVLELLVLELLCRKSAYGYELLVALRERSEGLFTMKEGTLYPILYRLEDEGFIRVTWSQGDGRTMPKKIYEATARGVDEHIRRRELWQEFKCCVDSILTGGKKNG